VRLADREVIGYEALSRGPVGSALERPDLLFAQARAEGRLAELDWQCRLTAMASALAGGLNAPLKTFVNIEPEVVDADCPLDSLPLLARALDELDLVLEVTERALTARPAQMLARIAAIRANGGLIALDDVGVDPRSLALMPFIRPDIVKLDMSLVQSVPTVQTALIAHAVQAYAEQSGAQVLAEGIETEEHAERARMLGATLGQGWLFGRPEELPAAPTQLHGRRARPSMLTLPAPAELTPMGIVGTHNAMQIARKQDMFAMSLALEHQAAAILEPCVVLGAFQTADRFTPATARRYEALVAQSAFVGAFGSGLDPEPAPGVRGADLDSNDQLAGEWDVLVIGPHFAAGLISQDLGDDGPDHLRRFRFVVVNDRETVLAAARSLMLRIAVVETTLALAA
jgi:EAL domain-containing protein (putative c-di-GMP-specific phosphodiesterase class I)